MMTRAREPQDARAVSLAKCERHTWNTHGATRNNGALGGGAAAAPATMAAVPYPVSARWLCPVPSHHQLVAVLRCAGACWLRDGCGQLKQRA
eukprot:9042087-Lingulodinium_polyedra.AAC.1